MSSDQPQMNLMGALRALSEVHTKDDAQAGYLIMFGAIPAPHQVDDYRRAWEVVRDHVDKMSVAACEGIGGGGNAGWPPVIIAGGGSGSSSWGQSSIEAVCAFPACTCGEGHLCPSAKVDAPPIALTDAHVRELERAVRAVGYDIFIDPDCNITLEKRP